MSSDFVPDVGYQLTQRFLDAVREADPVVGSLVDDWVFCDVDPGRMVVSCEVGQVRSGIEYETIFQACDVLDRIAKQSLGTGWRASVTFGAPA